MSIRDRIGADDRAVAVRADAVVHCDAEQARERLRSTLHAGAGRGSVGDVRLLVGPGGGAVHTDVRAHVADEGERCGSSLFTLRWEPVGRLAACYPRLDATVCITPIDATSSLLTVAGHYVPPLGAVGGAADRAGLHRIADSTIRAVARRLAATHAAPTSPEEGRHERDAEHTAVRG